MEKRPISRTGFDNLIKELKDLKEVQRPEILKTVQWARSLGDLSENADYSAAKEKQRQIDKRIQFIEGVIENAAIIDIDSLSGNRVVFGARVTAEDEDGNLMIAYHGELGLEEHLRCDGIRRIHFGKGGRPIFDMSADKDLDESLREVELQIVVK